jgi:hypothetical protein
MKKFTCKNIRLFLAGMAMLGLFSCGDDGEKNYADAEAPQVQLALEELFGEPGRAFSITGTIIDDVGIAGIRLQIAEWFLDKTILLNRDTLVRAYQLSYSFKMPEEGVDMSKNYSIVITVTDVAGKTAQATLSINPNGDFAAPELDAPLSDTITVLLKDNTVLDLDFTITDNKALAYVVVRCGGLNIYDSTATAEASYHYTKSISLGSQQGIYDFSVVAADKLGNLLEGKFVANVSEMPNFLKIYLTEFLTKETLNAHLAGIPVPASQTVAYTYTIDYYADKAGRGIYFIPQKTDLQPICFGIDPAESDVLSNDPKVSQPITFAEAGYYHITVNIKTGAYSTEKYVPASTTVNATVGQGGDAWTATLPDQLMELQLGIVGAGFPEYPLQDWFPGEAILLLQDSNNPWILYKELDMEGDVDMTITPLDYEHDGGWWLSPGWRIWQDGTANSSGSNGKWTASKRAKYRFELDVHLGRARILKL